VVVGLAVSATAEGMSYFDFLHAKEPEAAQRVRRRKQPMIAATVALFVLAAGVLAYQPIHRRKARIADLKAAKHLKNRNEDARELMLDQFQDYQLWQRSDVVWIDQLMRMAEAFPPNKVAYITKLEFDEKGEVSVDLAAKDEMVATRIVEQLTQVKDKQGELLFTAKPGKAKESTDKEYPVKDQVSVEIESLREES
jgi:flagellar basal body-associated protein FliL